MGETKAVVRLRHEEVAAMFDQAHVQDEGSFVRVYRDIPDENGTMKRTKVLAGFQAADVLWYANGPFEMVEMSSMESEEED